MLSKIRLAHLALFMVALIYGANYSIAKVVMDVPSFHPIALTGLRILTGAIVFIILYAIFIREKIDKTDIPLIIGCGLTGISINMTLFLLGLNYTNPINASLVMTTSPVLVLIFSYFLIKEYISIKNGIGIILALCGAVILIYRPGAGLLTESALGDFFIFLNGASYALYLVLVKKLIVKYSPITILMLIFSVGCFVVFPFSAGYISEVSWSSLDNTIYLSLTFVLVFTTCATYLLNIFALQHVRSSTAGSYIYLQPLIASFFAILMKKDQLSWKIVFCTAIIFLGLYLVSIKNKKI